MDTSWWHLWPGLERPSREDFWLKNYAMYWAKPAGLKPDVIISHRLRHTDCRIHVFSQYETLHEKIRAHRLIEEKRRSERPSSRHALPAQDGPVHLSGTTVGKTVFLHYYAVRLMAEQTPFILLEHQDFYVFTPNGVWTAASIPSSLRLFNAAANVPFIIDVDDRKDFPGSNVLQKSNFFFVQASSPTLWDKKFEWIQQHTTAAILDMDPHPDDEVIILLKLIAPFKPDHVIRKVLENHGSEIRILAQILLSDGELEADE